MNNPAGLGLDVCRAGGHRTWSDAAHVLLPDHAGDRSRGHSDHRRRQQPQ